MSKKTSNWRDQLVRDFTLQDLGFTPSMPTGNPSSPWWENEELDITFFGTPTCRELMEKLALHFKDEGTKSVREPILQALGLWYPQ